MIEKNTKSILDNTFVNNHVIVLLNILLNNHNRYLFSLSKCGKL